MRFIGSLLLVLFLIVLSPAAQAVPVIFSASLDGLSEAPPNASPGTGSVQVDFDIVAHTMRVQVTFSGLLGAVTTAHIHCCVAPPGTAGVATPTPTFPGFPLGVTSGAYDMTFDLAMVASFNASFLTAAGGTAAAAEQALYNGLLAGQAYFNVHTSVFPAGEIRGFLQATSVPEPMTLGLFALGLTALAFSARHRRFR